MARNPAEDKILTSGDIALLQRHGIDPEEVKLFNARLDLFKDADGNVYVKPKNGSGSGEPTGVNLKRLR